MALFDRINRKQKPDLPEEELRKHRCAFTGHRPEKLKGKEAYVIVELRKAIEAAIQEGYTTFISGCSRGTDLWAADIIIEMRRYNKDLKLICAIPFEGFDDRWPPDWKKHLKVVLEQADWIQIISKEYTPEAYQKRNIWMCRRSTKIIAVCNGFPSGTQNTIDFAQSQNIPVSLIRV